MGSHVKITHGVLARVLCVERRRRVTPAEALSGLAIESVDENAEIDAHILVEYLRNAPVSSGHRSSTLD